PGTSQPIGEHPDQTSSHLGNEPVHGPDWREPLESVLSHSGFSMKQSIVTLDMEGVLTPEIWIEVSEKTGIKELRLTTRDVPDYDVLMRGRLQILDRHGLK